MLRQILQGKPFGVPLHVILVHFPIALLLLSFIFDIATITDWSPSVRAAYLTMAFGVLTAVLAAVPGIADYTGIRRDHPGRRVAVYHMLLNLAAVALYIVNLAIRSRHLDPPTLPIVALVLALIGVAILSLSGYLGGVLVYDDGIGVGRHRRRGKTPVETIRRSSADARDGFVEVADEDQLENHQSLRADIDGVVMAIAKVDGKLYAFQEFCTHRYGPLSEGCFEGETVRCPWHRSCFNMKTGEVVEGPAKEPIRAFEIVVRDGKVMIKLPGEASS